MESPRDCGSVTNGQNWERPRILSLFKPLLQPSVILPSYLRCHHRRCKEPVGTAPPRLNPRRRTRIGRRKGREGNHLSPPAPSLSLSSSAFGQRHFLCPTNSPLPSFLPSLLPSTVTQKSRKKGRLLLRRTAKADGRSTPTTRRSQTAGRTDRWSDLAAFQHICQGGDHRSEAEGTCKSGLFDSPVISHPRKISN